MTNEDTFKVTGSNTLSLQLLLRVNGDEPAFTLEEHSMQRAMLKNSCSIKI